MSDKNGTQDAQDAQEPQTHKRIYLSVKELHALSESALAALYESHLDSDCVNDQIYALTIGNVMQIRELKKLALGRDLLTEMPRKTKGANQYGY